MNININPQDKLILLCAKINPTAHDLDLINNLLTEITNWEAFATHIIKKSFAPLLYIKLDYLPNANLIPESIKTLLKATYYKTSSRSILLLKTFADCLLVLKSNNIDIIALKGIYLSDWLYKNPALRLMSDVDLLVKEADGIRCVELLKEIGFVQYQFVKNISSFSDKIDYEAFLNSGEAHFLPLQKANIYLEIHTKLQNRKEQNQQIIPEIWKHAKPITLNELPVLALDNYNLLIHLCLHLHKHITVLKHVQFMSFADITNILCEIDGSKNNCNVDLNAEKKTLSMGFESFVWDEFVAKCTMSNCLYTVFKYLILCKEYFNAPLPNYLFEKYKNTFTDYDRDLFLKHLSGYDFTAFANQSYFPIHARNIKYITNPLLKLRYVLDVVFPPKSFMVFKYLQNNNQPEPKTASNTNQHSVKFWWIWYPYRWWKGLKGIVIKKR